MMDNMLERSLLLAGESTVLVHNDLIFFTVGRSLLVRNTSVCGLC